jgi:hypothetical protein
MEGNSGQQRKYNGTKNEKDAQATDCLLAFSMHAKGYLLTISELHSYLERPYCVHTMKYDEHEHRIDKK